jgi:hypothetical protein
MIMENNFGSRIKSDPLLLLLTIIGFSILGMILILLILAGVYFFNINVWAILLFIISLAAIISLPYFLIKKNPKPTKKDINISEDENYNSFINYLKFNKLIYPKLVVVIHLIVLILILFMGLFTILNFISDKTTTRELIIALITLTVVYLSTRIMLELNIIIFKIYQKL